MAKRSAAMSQPIARTHARAFGLGMPPSIGRLYPSIELQRSTSDYRPGKRPSALARRRRRPRVSVDRPGFSLCPSWLRS